MSPLLSAIFVLETNVAAWPVMMYGRYWPEDVAAAVSSIEVTKRNLEAGDGKQEDVVKIRL
jgi:hypothetical protein